MAQRNIYLSQAPNEDLQGYARRLAKAVDQRLVRLEKYAEREEYSGVKEWAYKGAMYDIKRIYGEGNRFNRGIPKSGVELTRQQELELMRKINAMRDFIEKPSSTATGVKDIYQKQADTFNKNNGTNFTWKELANFFNSKSYKKLEQISYKSTFKMANFLKDNDLKTKKEIREFIKQHKNSETFSGDEVLDKFILDAVNDKDIRISQLVGKKY